MSEENSRYAVSLATDLTIAWLGNQNNRAPANEVPGFLRSMYAAVSELMNGSPISPRAAVEVPAQKKFIPAVSVRKSLASKDYIISMIDGRPYRALRRHLLSFGLTPEEYRERYNLKPDYPMVAENYSAERRAVAKRIGLGRRGAQAMLALRSPTVERGPTESKSA